MAHLILHVLFLEYEHPDRWWLNDRLVNLKDLTNSI